MKTLLNLKEPQDYTIKKLAEFKICPFCKEKIERIIDLKISIGDNLSNWVKFFEKQKEIGFWYNDYPDPKMYEFIHGYCFWKNELINDFKKRK